MMTEGLILTTPRSVKIREVIEVEAVRGKGTEDERIRVVTQYYSRDGELLAENDPCA